MIDTQHLRHLLAEADIPGIIPGEQHLALAKACINALPHLLAIAEAAARLCDEDLDRYENPYPDRWHDLHAAVKEWKESKP